MVYKFTASRFSNRGKLFPNQIVIDNVARKITFYKKRLIGYDCTIINGEKITSVTLHRFNELLFLSAIVISIPGGEISANGFKLKDAVEIKTIIESIM